VFHRWTERGSHASRKTMGVVRGAAPKQGRLVRGLLGLCLLPTPFACGGGLEGELSRFDGSDLPVAVLDTAGQEIPDEPKIEGRLRVYAAGVEGLAALAAPATHFDGSVAIEVRGYTSQALPKKQYGFEVRDAQARDADVSLLGLPAESDWILHAPFVDKSLMRNQLAYELSRRMGRYAPRTEFLELFLIDDRAAAPELFHYRGVYVLTERIERGVDRVDIERLEPSMMTEPEVAGGYLLEWTERSRLERGEVMFSTRRAEALLIRYPKPEDVTDAQVAWIHSYVDDLEAALSLLGREPDSEAFESYLDLDACVDYFLLSELLRNHDVFVASTFIHKPRAGKLVMGPMWDLDRALGDVELDGNWSATGWLLPSRGWGRDLFLSRRFQQRYVERWREHRQSALDLVQLGEIIGATERRLEGPAARNFEKWRVLGQYVKANRAPYSKSFREEIDKLTLWLGERAIWMDEHIEELRGPE
jgi:hypothetical protein